MKYALAIIILLTTVPAVAQSVYVPTVGVPPLQGATGSQPINPCPFGCMPQPGR